MEHAIKTLRDKRKWTQKQFADELERLTGVRVGIAMIGHVENFIRNFSYADCVEIERAFKIPVAKIRTPESLLRTSSRAA